CRRAGPEDIWFSMVQPAAGLRRIWPAPWVTEACAPGSTGVKVRRMLPSGVTVPTSDRHEAGVGPSFTAVLPQKEPLREPVMWYTVWSGTRCSSWVSASKITAGRPGAGTYQYVSASQVQPSCTAEGPGSAAASEPAARETVESTAIQSPKALPFIVSPPVQGL